jgi:hypothetical protein
MNAKKQEPRVDLYSPAEKRAARAERVQVTEAEPYGWVAASEMGREKYILYADPFHKRLVCTCADFIYRSKDGSPYECKHVTAVLKFIGRWYLTNEYDPQKQIQLAILQPLTQEG